MSNTKHKITSMLLILSLIFTMFALNTIPANAATKTLKLKASASSQTQAVLSWNKISKPYNGYAVFRDGKVIKYFGKGTTKFTDSGLASGSAHSYQIKSYKKTKQYYNSKKKKWQNSKPKASQWKGKQTRYVYSYKTKSNVATIRTNYAYYTITWKNWNGSTLATTTVRQGLTPSYDGTPSKPADANYTYTFTGWSPDITVASGNKTYTAQYRAVAKPTYTVTWKNYNGTILKTESVKAGVVPSYTGSTPTRPADTDNTYTFTGWSPTPTAVTNNVIYVAQYKTNPKPTYTITWKNWNGNTLKTDTVREGVTPSYSGNKPSRTATDTYVYTFTSWSPDIVAAHANATYTAQFVETPRYTITWKNWDGTVLRTDKVKLGVKPVYPGTPSRAEDDDYVYQFAGWNPNIVVATGNATYTATYNRISKFSEFTVTWKNWNNEVLKTETVRAGATPSYTGTPVKPEDDNAYYEFKGWSPAVGPITQDTEYIAQYKTYTKYTITWKNWNDKVLKTDRVKAGDTPAYTGNTPTKPETGTCTYIFKGWTPSVTAVTGNAEYKAQFTEVAKPTSIEIKPSQYNYSMRILNEPYGNDGKMAVYFETNNPDEFSYTLGILNSSNQEKKLNGGFVSTNKYSDVNLSSLNGKLYVCSPECTGNCTLVVFEYDDVNGTKDVVAAKPISVKDYKAEELIWMQSVINQTTNTNMTNKQKMHAICNYILDTFTYTTNDGSGQGYITLISDVGKPYWETKQTNSAESPAQLVRFGNLLNYSLINMYPLYEINTPEWEEYHAYAYSKTDDEYYLACPDSMTGYMNPDTIQMFNPNTYQFWDE